MFSANVISGKNRAEIAFDDMFIRKFMAGTWHNLFVDQVGAYI